MVAIPLLQTHIEAGFTADVPLQHFPAHAFPYVHPIHWLHSHFAVGGWSPLQRLSGMLTAHMTQIAPRNGFTWHPHRGLEIYTWVLEGRLYHEDTTGGKGVLAAGDLQRMFSGDYIEHQELNPWDEPARVIQIWFIADLQYRGLPPHYQQIERDGLPVRRVGAAQVYELIGQGSPMESHVNGTLTATYLPAESATWAEAPTTGNDLFLYITDGDGTLEYNGQTTAVGQYDVLLARPDMAEAKIRSGERELSFLSFYLPQFL
jgi:hypothetical protein